MENVRKLASASDDQAVIAAMHASGAVSPRTACRRRELPPAVVERFSELVDRGLVREGAPGTYYLYVAAANPSRSPSGFNWRRFAATLLFWFVLILLPVALIQLSAGR
jgi:hypothetical protein